MNNQYTIQKTQSREGEFLRETYVITFAEDTLLAEDEIKFGRSFTNVNEQGSIMTHEPWRTEYTIPYAFPAVISRISGQTEADIIYLCDKKNSSSIFNRVVRAEREKLFYVGFCSCAGKVKAGTYYFIQYVRITAKSNLLFTELIGIAASKALNLFAPEKSFYLNGKTYRLHNYTDACLALTKNIMDERARPGNNDIATLCPYAYFEIMEVSESFASLGALKGLYPFSLLTGDQEGFTFASRELHRMADLGSPWMESAHNTDFFFHNHYEKGVFTDVDGHEEGPNLLSTWKYYDRVLRIGEMYDVSGDKTFKEAFLKLIPFILSLKCSDGSQPVTYDLDTHESATGKEDGGSAGGQGLWIVLALMAYRFTGEKSYLEKAESAAKQLNTLDWFNMFSMRCAPTARGVGWTLKANVQLYEITKNENYLNHASRIAKGLYGYYYLNSNPHTYFSTLGFCYACGRERWESARDICENVWLQLPLLRYRIDENVLQLISYFRQNYLWVLPINGVPMGFPDAGYDSVGAEYVPFEFNTGTVGDTTGDWSFQSERRQVKELYGAAEIFVAQYMFEAFGNCADDRDMLLNLTPQQNILHCKREFIIRCGQKEHLPVVRFCNLHDPAYELWVDKTNLGVFDADALSFGISIPVQNDIARIFLIPSKKNYTKTEKIVKPFNVNLREVMPNVYRCTVQVDYKMSHILIKYGSVEFISQQFEFDVDNSEEHAENLIVTLISEEGSVCGNRQFPLNPVFVRVETETKFSDDVKGISCKLVCDGAMAMVHPKNVQKRSGLKYNFSVREADGVIVEIASLNGSAARVSLTCEGKPVCSKNVSFPQKLWLPLAKNGKRVFGNCRLTILSDGGFSVGMMCSICSFDRKPCQSNLFSAEEWTKTSFGIEKIFWVDTSYTPYFIAVSNRAKDYKIVLETNTGKKELRYDLENRIPRTYHRLPDSVFIFRLNDFISSDEREIKVMIEGTNFNNTSFRAIGLESCNRYPALHRWLKNESKAAGRTRL